jgi:hypothetical protein
MYLWVNYKKKNMEKKNISDPEPDPLVRGADSDPLRNVTDPQHCYGVGEMFFFTVASVSSYKY